VKPLGANREGENGLMGMTSREAGRTLLQLFAENLATDLPIGGFTNVVETLVWSLNEDASAAMLELREEWLRGDDERLATLAIAVGEIFPFRSRGEMESVFAELVQKFPALTKRANDLISERRKLNEAS
jgi:hypothetical protein